MLTIAWALALRWPNLEPVCSKAEALSVRFSERTVGVKVGLNFVPGSRSRCSSQSGDFFRAKPLHVAGTLDEPDLALCNASLMR